MDTIQTINITPTQYHILSIAARGNGQTVEEYTAATLTRLFKGLADLKGLRPVKVKAAQVTHHQPELPLELPPAAEPPQPAAAPSAGMFDIA